MVNVLQTKINHFSHAVQIADIHIRLTKRRDEYLGVFKSFYEQLDSVKYPSFTVISGDIFHNKTDLSPESVQMCTDFLSEVADRTPTILVAGNHDCNMSNKSRMDCLTPIVGAIRHPNLYYLRESGLYALGNVLINNMSVFDPTEKYIRGTGIPKIYKNKYDCIVGIFHGQVDSAINDQGYKFTNKEINNEFFDGHHIVMLGDIHKAQNLQSYDEQQEKPIIRYVGSLCQQNHGESLKNHGYTLWDLKNKSYNHVEVLNDYGHFTIDVKKGKLDTDITNLPSKCRLRVRCFETVATEVKKVLTEIRDKTEVQEVVYERVASADDDKSVLVISGKDLELVDLGKIDHQESLITKFLKDKLKISDENIIKKVLEINKEVNNIIGCNSAAKCTRWKPKKFIWSNMFSYGENNVIDFTKINNIYGLFAPNSGGKSSILSALSFCIFDKCDRDYKASNILNVQKTSFNCKFNFEINGVDYFIERTGTADRKGTVKVEVEFWKEVNGVKEDLNGEQRYDTNDIIRKYIGTYDDFLLTTLSIQNAKNVSSFIDMGHTERKDILSKFIGLGIFDELYTISSKSLGELSAIIKNFNKDDNTQKLVDLHRALDTLGQIQTSESEKKTSFEESRNRLNSRILEETSKLIKLDESVGNWTDEQITSKIDDIDKSRGKLILTRDSFIKLEMSKRPQLEITIRSKTDELNEIDKKIVEMEKKNLSEIYNKHQSYLVEYNRIKTQMDLLDMTIKSQEEKMVHLGKHEYDPNCKYCVNNIFVKDAIKTKSELETNKKKKLDVLVKVEEAKKLFESCAWVVKEQSVYTSHLTQRNRIKDELTLASNKVIDVDKAIKKVEDETESKIAKLNDDLKTWNDRLQKFKLNKDSIQSNFKVEASICSLKREIESLEKTLHITEKVMMETVGRVNVAKNEIDHINQSIEKAKNTEVEIQAYDLYVKSVCRDGIPYEIICGAVPEIEREVNLILNQIVEFHAKFETDGKNVIPYIVYDNLQWPMSMSGGFEKFALSLAIRVALINISNLPRPNFLVVDEGFGTADSDNLAEMHTLFSFLKSNFDFILIASHLDSMKDMVDGTIEIRKENGFSIVNFS